VRECIKLNRPLIAQTSLRNFLRVTTFDDLAPGGIELSLKTRVTTSSSGADARTTRSSPIAMDESVHWRLVKRWRGMLVIGDGETERSVRFRREGACWPRNPMGIRMR